MDFTIYAVFVTIAAIIYSFVAREIQYRFGNRKEMEEFQKKSKDLTDQMNEANKRKDQKKMDELLQKQTELMPQMGKMMIGQFKTMAMVLVVFFAITWVVNTFDPTTKDDFVIQMLDDGKGCDVMANDFTFTACYTPASENYGAWAVDVTAFNEGNGNIGENSTYFYYNVKNGPIHVKGAKGELIPIELSSQKIDKTDTIKISVYSTKAKTITAKLDNGTLFYVDLPFTIPILGINRINETYWWFIFVTLISGLAMSFIFARLQKKPQGEAK